MIDVTDIDVGSGAGVALLATLADRHGAPMALAVAEAVEEVAERVVVELSVILGAKGSACDA